MTSRLLPWLALLLTLLPLAGAAGGSGTVRQGEIDAYSFGPGGGEVCDPVIERHTATLTYAPRTDVLDLAVGNLAVHGVAGRATLVFLAPSCPGFEVRVTGTLVASEALYTLDVA